jgi:hypothetical protein
VPSSRIAFRHRHRVLVANIPGRMNLQARLEFSRADSTATCARAMVSCAASGWMTDPDGRSTTCSTQPGLIARATGGKIDYLNVAPEAFAERQIRYGVPENVANLLTGLLIDLRDGRSADPADGVRRALGRPPRSFEDFVMTTLPGQDACMTPAKTALTTERRPAGSVDGNCQAVEAWPQAKIRASARCFACGNANPDKS